MKFSQYSKEQRQLAKAVYRVNEAMKDIMICHEMLNEENEIDSIAFDNLRITIDQLDNEALIIRCTWKFPANDNGEEK